MWHEIYMRNFADCPFFFVSQEHNFFFHELGFQTFALAINFCGSWASSCPVFHIWYLYAAQKRQFTCTVLQSSIHYLFFSKRWSPFKFTWRLQTICYVAKKFVIKINNYGDNFCRLFFHGS